jgi:hypothetical protein
MAFFTIFYYFCGVDDVVAALPGPSRILEEGRGSPVSWEEVVEIFKSW